MGKAEIRLLGTGNAFQQDGRGAQSILVETENGEPVAIDVGPTAAAASTRFGAPLARMRHLFITHLHGDHIAGWPFVLLQMIFIEKRTRPLDIWGPPGVRERLEGLMALCYPRIAADQAKTIRMRYHELPVGRRDGLDADGLEFDVFPMDHIESSIGFGLRVDGRYVCVTGDTRWCPSLGEMAERAEILLMECTSLVPGAYPHLSLEEVREQRATFQSGRWVLVHLPDAVALALAADPLPGVIAGADGMRISL